MSLPIRKADWLILPTQAMISLEQSYWDFYSLHTTLANQATYAWDVFILFIITK